MLSIKITDISNLNPDQLALYQQLTPSEYRYLFEPSTLMVGIEDNDIPRGICLCQIDSFFKNCLICHLNAPEDLVGELLSVLEEHLRNIKYLNLFITYKKDKSLDQILQSDGGWCDPQTWATRYIFESKTFHPKWLERKYNLPQNYKIIHWEEIQKNEEEQSRIKFHLKQYGVPEYLSPFVNDEYIQSINSLALLHEKHVVGWMITHTFPDAPDTVRYSSLYVHPDNRHMSYSIMLLIQSIKLQKATPIPYSHFEILHSSAPMSWKKFCRCRLKPHTKKVVQLSRRKKEL